MCPPSCAVQEGSHVRRARVTENGNFHFVWLLFMYLAQGPEATVLERAGPELGGQGRLLGTRIEEPSAEAIVQERSGRKRLE